MGGFSLQDCIDLSNKLFLGARPEPITLLS